MASQTALSVISNNLANMNTTGYKDNTVSFQDLFYQNIGSTGSGDPEQVGAGVTVGSISTNFTGGDLQTTGVDTDVAVSNNGFFVLQGPGGENLYTRDGEFTVNTAGNLVSQDGYEVLGYSATNGVVNTSQALGPLQLGSGQMNPPQATSSMQLQSNLNASSAVGTSYSTPIDVYDSLGDSHVVTVDFTKTAANTWGYTMSVPGADVGVNPSTWSSATEYTAGQTIVPNPANGYMYKCTTAGTSGATAPTFLTGAGATVTDGNAITGAFSSNGAGGAFTGGVTATQATGTLEMAAQPAAASTVKVGTQTYTFQVAAVGAAGEVQIGANQKASLQNLAAAINGSDGFNTTNTLISAGAATDVVVGTDADATLTLTANTAGTVAGTAAGLGNALGGTSNATWNTAWDTGATAAVNGNAATATFTLGTQNLAVGSTLDVGATTYTFIANGATPANPTQIALGTTVSGTVTAIAAAIAANTGDPSVSAVQSGANGNILTFTTAATTAAANATTASGVLTGGTAAVWTEESTYPPVISSGTLNFNGSGALTSWANADAVTSPVTTNITGISVTGLADGASPLTFDWDLTNNGAPLITQMATASSTPTTTQNGTSSGTLTSFSINSNGTIEGAFANGTQVLGQIALAGFNNQEGLSRQGSDNFTATLASGQAAIGAPGTSGLGTVTGGSLESSNVDIATEFSNLIIAQRMFEANAKSITTFDEIMQDTINLKH
jgi:flagellar hook protein FlgE